MHLQALGIGQNHKVPSALHSRARRPSLSQSKRLSNCHICFKSPAESRFERSENGAIHLYSLIISAAAMLAFEGCGLRDKYGFKVHPLYLYMRILYRLNVVLELAKFYLN